MNADDFPTPDVDVETTDPESLKDRIDAGEDVTLLDARMQSDYDEWRIDGENVTSLNIPYFEFLEDDIDGDVLAQIPDDHEVTVLCAKGGASEYVAGTLAEHGYDVNHLEDGMNGWASIYEAVEVERYDAPAHSCSTSARPPAVWPISFTTTAKRHHRPAAGVHRPVSR